MSRSKYWCFTLNNYEEGDIAHLIRLQTDAHSTYIVFGREVGANATRHLQGYIELPQRARLNQIKDLLGRRYHLEPRRGTAKQASDYCKKDGDFTEIGDLSRSNQGERTDLLELRQALDRGTNLATISQDFFGIYLRYQKNICIYRSIHSQKRNWETKVYVFWGLTGTGKTRKVHDTISSNGQELYIHPGGSWFDGYDGEDNVLFDDYSGSCFALPYLLKLLDRYPMQVPIKGAFVNWKPRTIYITSNLDPRLWYPNAHQEHKNALTRRITEIHHYNGTIGQDILVNDV